MMNDLEMPWKPFGLTLTFSEFNKILTTYVQNYISERLDKEEEDYHAF